MVLSNNTGAIGPTVDREPWCSRTGVLNMFTNETFASVFDKTSNITIDEFSLDVRNPKGEVLKYSY